MSEDASPKFKLAIEVAGTQVRFGLVPADQGSENIYPRMIRPMGYRNDFKGNALSDNEARFVYEKALEFLQARGVTKEQIIAIGITAIAYFGDNKPIKVDTLSLQSKLSDEFTACNGKYAIVSQNRTVIAARTEWEYGYGKDNRPSRFIYFTISKNVNLNYLKDGRYDPQDPADIDLHAEIPADKLKDYEGESSAITPCECGKKLCFMNLVSGYGMAKQMAAIVTTNIGDPFINFMKEKISDENYAATYDLGGVFPITKPQKIDLTEVYGRAVVEAAIGTGAVPNENAVKIVKRACAALGYIISAHLKQLNPNVVVLGGIFSRLNPEYIKICRRVVNQNSDGLPIDISSSELEGVAALLGAAIYANPPADLQQLWKN